MVILPGRVRRMMVEGIIRNDPYSTEYNTSSTHITDSDALPAARQAGFGQRRQLDINYDPEKINNDPFHLVCRRTRFVYSFVSFQNCV